MSEKIIQVPRTDCLRNLLKWINFPLIGRRSVYKSNQVVLSYSQVSIIEGIPFD